MIKCERLLFGALENAGLSTTYANAGFNYIGANFYFYCEHGSHHQVLAGTITGIGLSDEGGLKLYVSVPEFWDEPLLFLRYNETENAWEAILANDESRAEDRYVGFLSIRQLRKKLNNYEKGFVAALLI